MAYINNIDNKFLNLQISQLMLKKLIQYAVYPSKRVSKKDKRNLQELINSISYETSYEESQVNERYSFKFLRELINMVVDGYSDIEVVANYFMEKEGKIDGYPTEVLNTILSWIQIAVENEGLFNDSDLKMMRDFISNRLQYLFIFKSLPEINRSAERLNNESVDIKSIVETTTPLIKKLDIDLRRSKYVNEDRFLDTSIGARQSSDRDRDLDSLQEIIQASRNKDAKLISGYRSLNKIINGGFAKDRVYVFSAVPKHFKSGTLLNIAVSVARNNHYTTKNPNNKPCIVYFSMENSVVETYERLYSLVTGKELADTKENWKLVVKAIDDYININDIALKIIYRPGNSVDTSYIEDIIENCEAEGYEVIMMVQDYLKRINSYRRPHDELRLVLGSVVDEFEDIAKEHHIPIVTAAQLNRAAYELVDDQMIKGNNDVAKSLGTKHIAESAQIIENCDYAIIINRENLFNRTELTDIIPSLKPKNNPYLSFKLLISRANSKTEDATYFAQPFDNGFRLTEDVREPESKAVKDIRRVLNDVLDDTEKSELSSRFGYRFDDDGVSNSFARPLTKDEINSYDTYNDTSKFATGTPTTFSVNNNQPSNPFTAFKPMSMPGTNMINNTMNHEFDDIKDDSEGSDTFGN